ncbi:MAG: hypothetical protein J6S76_02115 [Clostridia bacterium]|nr:hypothetical protein [Clostridia bacterium]
MLTINERMKDLSAQTGGPGKNNVSRDTALTMVLCVCAAICIWFYVMSIDSPTSSQVYSSVSVSIQNNRDLSTDLPLTPISGNGSVIEVTLKGRKTVLNNLRAEDITAYVDVSGAKSSGKNVYPVVVEAPDGTVIEDYYPKEITVYMDKRSVVNVPVEAYLSQYSIMTGYTVNLASPTLSVDTIQVWGPESELSKISCARLSISPGIITNSFSGTGELVLLDGNGAEINDRYLTLSHREATAKFYVYTTKTVALNVAYKYGFFAENGTQVTVLPQTVVVRGTVEALNDLQSITVTTIDETKITEDGVHALDLNLPDGVTLVNPDASQAVSIRIRFTNAILSKVRVSTSDVQIVNVPDGKTVEILDDMLTISARGIFGSIMNLRETDFEIVADASAAVNNGDQYVSVSVAIKQGNSAQLYPVGDYSLQIRVSDVQQ